MKKIFILTTLVIISLNLLAQKIIENPRFSATTANYVKITKIELYDTVTKIDFEVRYFPNWWISVSSDKTCIQNSKGGDKLFVKRADGIILNEKKWTPESGVNTYTLYFPAIDNTIESIDFLEESWRIYDINISGKVLTSFIPEELKGNWLKTDGSNEWVYGIYDDKVIYKDKIWNNVLLNNKGKSYELILKHGSDQEIIYIKRKKENLLIGNSLQNLQLFSKTKTYKPGYTIENDETFSLPVFNRDTAIYRGFIAGYHPKMGNTGMVYVNDIIIHEQNSHLITINEDGSFECKIPMIHPEDIFIRMFNTSESIYLEPGKTVFHYIDLSEYTSAFKSYDDRKKRERKSLFMGGSARINSDLLAMDTINYYSYDKTQSIILDMSGNDYKTYRLNIMKEEQIALEQFTLKYPVCKKALQIKNMQIQYNAFENIFSFNRNKSYAYREKHKIPRDQQEIPLESEKFEPEYYDFIHADDLNNPVSLASGGAYNYLINRIRFSENVRNKYYFVEVKHNVPIYDTIAQKDTIVQIDSLFLEDPKTKDRILISGREEYEQMEVNNMKTYFGLDKGLATEIMFAQSKCEMMKGRQKPFDESVKKDIKEKVSNDFIVEYLMQYSNDIAREIEEKLQANKTKTGYVINETPKTEGDKLFEAIIEKYKGKLVFVDFWATWCGPCRSGMEKIKPLKEELKGEDIEFVYITNQSSPIDTWNMMVPDIKGEHYRVEQDEWNYFSSKFNISGIPHYILVDKNGTVVNDKIYFASSNEELKKLFYEYLKQ